MKSGIFPSVIFCGGRCKKVWRVKGVNLFFRTQSEASLFRAGLLGK